MMSNDRLTPLARFTRRAKEAAAALKGDFAAGKRGDTTPPAPIWATPGEQLDAVKRLIRPSTAASHDSGQPGADISADTSENIGDDNAESDEDDADSMNAAMRLVDWTKVREATADRTSSVARAAQQLADQVDWGKVQPRARQVSRAVIAAVASGQLGVGGRLGGIVARTIVDQGGLAERVSGLLEREPEQIRSEVSGVVIDTTASDG